MEVTTNFLINARCFAKGTSLASAYARRKRIKNMGSKSAALKLVDSRFPNLDDARKSEIVDDLVLMARKFHYGYDEYFYYHFMDRTMEDRLSFVSDMVRCDFVRTLNKAVNQHVFDDKGNCARRFAKFYHRDFCVVHKPLIGKLNTINIRSGIRDVAVGDGGRWGGQIADLQCFIDKHNRFIVKPVAGSCGKGVKIYNASDFANVSDLIKELLDSYCVGWNGGFIAEEVIVQDKQMASLHPKSVNTVRLTTIKYDESKVDVIHPFMRIGRGGKVVDNGGAGGLLADIDYSTGKIFACMDENATVFEKHPDSGLDIIGFKIPHWEDALNLAKELALVVKGNRYTGWDLALTDTGWVMVEGNPMGQFVGWQIPSQKGFMPEAQQILKELNKRPLRY